MKTTDNAGVHTPHHNVDKLLSVSAAGQATMANSLPVAIASDQSAVKVKPDQPTATTFTVTASSQTSSSVSVAGYDAFVVSWSGTFAGVTVLWEISYDGGTNWVTAVLGKAPNTVTSLLSSSGALTNNINAYTVPCPGATHARVRSTAYTSGQMDVLITPISIAVPQFMGVDLVSIKLVDNAGFTDGSSTLIPAGYYFDETAGTALTENDIGAARMDSKRAIVVGIEDATTRGQRTAVDAQGALSVKEKRAATPAQSSVAGSASSVSILASNANRLGATVYNDSTAVLYLKLGTTASTSSFTVKMVADAYYEVPFGYTGAIDGIWASATGNARITELAA